MGKIHLTSIFTKRFKKSSTLSVKRIDPGYEFFVNEYRNGLARDPFGNLIVRNEREELQKSKERIEALIRYRRLNGVISRSSQEYSYFLAEYRQNSPMRDSYGNILLDDEITNIKTR